MMRARLALILAAAATLAGSPARAVQPDEILKDPALETRAREISAGLRCLVCQNQSIDDSDAPLARDLRLLVRERIVAGESDPQVRSFLVGRYGEFVLLRPTLAWHNVVLWAGPLVVVLAAFAGLLVASRRYRPPAEPDLPLSATEEARILALRNEGPDPRHAAVAVAPARHDGSSMTSISEAGTGLENR